MDKKCEIDSFLGLPLVSKEAVRDAIKLTRKLIGDGYLLCSRFMEFFKKSKIVSIQNLLRSNFYLLS